MALLSLPHGIGGRIGYGAIGDEIWCGVIFVATGGVGIASATHSSRRITIALWILSLISAVFSVPQTVDAGLGFAYSW